MKNAFLFALFFAPFGAFSQGQIISLTVDPPNPTTADFVRVYAELMFTSGGCDLDNQSHNTSGNITTATANHCLGMLTVICDITDTFELGYLSAGTHQFDLTITSGSAPAPCTPGTSPNDSETISFNVQSGVGVQENEESLVSVYPNPAGDFMIMEIDSKYTDGLSQIVVTDALGREVMLISEIHTAKTVMDITSFSKGFYFFRLEQHQMIVTTGKFIKE